MPFAGPALGNLQNQSRRNEEVKELADNGCSFPGCIGACWGSGRGMAPRAAPPPGRRAVAGCHLRRHRLRHGNVMIVKWRVAVPEAFVAVMAIR